MRFKEYLLEAVEPTRDEIIEQFKHLKQHVMKKDYGHTEVLNFVPVKNAHVFWYSKTGELLYFVEMTFDWKSKRPDEEPITTDYWVEWNPKAQKTALVADFADHQRAKMGGAILSMIDDSNVELKKTIEARTGHWVGIDPNWPADT